MLRKRKAGPRKATAPLSQKAAQLQEEEGSLLDDSAKAAIARLHSERQDAKRTAAAPADGAADGAAPAGGAAGGAASREASASATGGEAAAPHGAQPDAPAGARATQGASEEGPSVPDGARDAAKAQVAPSASSDVFPDGKQGIVAGSDAGEPGSPAADASAASEGGLPGEAAGERAAGDVASREGRGGSAPKKRPARAKAKLGKRKVALIACLSVVAVVLICFAALSWNRWLRYDDAADLQGEWLVQGGVDSITIDASLIHLTDQDAYGYAIDTTAKTLHLTFGDLSGDARYRFSADRTQLAIQDGTYGATGTFFDDLSWSFGDFASSVSGGGAASPAFGEGCVVLKRVDALTDEERQALEQRRLEQMTPEEQAAAQAEAERIAAEQAAAEEEQRQQELNIQEALEGSGTGEVGANAVRPEDLM